MPKLPIVLNTPPRDVAVRVDVLIERARRTDREGRVEEAIRLYRRILEMDPLNVQLMTYLGIALAGTGKYGQAIVQFDNALRIDPDQPVAWLNRAIALEKTGRLAEALACHDRIVALRPDWEAGHLGRAGALHAMGRFEEALAAYAPLEPLMERMAEVPANRGGVWHAMGHVEDAMRDYGRALALQPAHPWALLNKATLLLLTGNFQDGFALYESRHTIPEMKQSAPSFTQPLWLGETNIAGKTILLYEEQGIGNTIQFCRYAALAAEAGARVVMEAQKPLVELMTTLTGVSQIVAEGDPLPAFDLRCPTMSLPLAFGTTLETIPGKVPYLHADPARAAVWRERLSGLTGRRIGLVWAGGSRLGHMGAVATDQRRSVPLATLAPLAQVNNCVFVSIQLGRPAAQAAMPPAGMILHDYTAELNSFADTAALIENLDLVISVDTSTAHLAAAMGKPVWLLNRFDTCWRWLLDRDDSPWYPTLRQFRQPRPGDWASVAARVAEALRGFTPS